MKAIGPYSLARKHNDLLYTSGIIAVNQEGELVESFSQQVKQCLLNLEHVLKEFNTDKNKVLKVTVYLTDLNNYAMFNELYGEFFQHEFPSRTVVEVSKLPKDAKIELECIAVVEK